MNPLPDNRQPTQTERQCHEISYCSDSPPLLATGSAFASTTDSPAVIHDKAGFFVQMDVAKVLSTTDLSDQCGVIPAKLDYWITRVANMCWTIRFKGTARTKTDGEFDQHD